MKNHEKSRKNKKKQEKTRKITKHREQTRNITKRTQKTTKHYDALVQEPVQEPVRVPVHRFSRFTGSVIEPQTGSAGSPVQPVSGKPIRSGSSVSVQRFGSEIGLPERVSRLATHRLKLSLGLGEDFLGVKTPISGPTC